MKKKHEEELIAHLVDREAAAPELRRWLETPAGRREAAAYQRGLRSLQHVYGQAPAAAPRVRYTSLAWQSGRIFVAATPVGVVRLAFRRDARDERDFVRELRRRLGMEAARADDDLAEAAHQVQDYLAGRRQAFALPVDLRLTTPFQRQVLAEAAKIPRGQTLTYSEVARRLGRPRAARAVGQALSRNPVPLIVPCHRVLAADGSLRGYLGGGIQRKAQLLRLEGVA